LEWLLKEKHPTVEFKGVTADCSTKTTVKEYSDLIEAEMGGLDYRYHLFKHWVLG